jgi:energy-coupling factor transporter ATP-binding protein EcfA2
MLLGDILVAKGIASRADMERAFAYQREHGGRIGDCLVAMGIVTPEQIEGVLTEAPPAPRRLEDTGLDPMFLLQLMVKGMYTENLETPSRIAGAMHLPRAIVATLIKGATERKIIEGIGQAEGGGALAEVRHQLTRLGREWAADALEQSSYFGPAPVPYKAYVERVMRQRITNERVSRQDLEKAFHDLVLPESFITRLGPAINSGTAILIYGPAGNGKTTVAEVVGGIFENVIYVPHCFTVDGQIIKVFDPTVHRTIEGGTSSDGTQALRRDHIDQRWVPCYRPMVITGGELTLDMLDLKYDEVAKFYEAPMHIKALNGTFLIDDFGRQRVKPEEILNRWIVPLNSRVDYLNLHTGKSVRLPFDQLVIFSTNLRPNDLMDPAFQRRIAYKLETVEPPEELFRQVFTQMAARRGLDLTEQVYRQVVEGIRAYGAGLAYFQPKFIVEQVLSSCKFEGIPPQFTPQNIDDALLNLFVANEDDMPRVA